MTMRQAFELLDKFYALCGLLAAVSLVLMLAAITLQIAGAPLNFSIPGVDAYAVYFLSATTFLGLAQTLAMGQHIRVTLLLEKTGPAFSRSLNIASHIAGSLLAVFMAFIMIRLVWQSHRFGDLSNNLDAMPLWIPQSVSAFGAVAFAIAAVDRTIRLIVHAPVHEDESPMQAE